MTRRTRTSREAENRLDELETDVAAESNHTLDDELRYMRHCNDHGEDAQTRAEFFGEGWVAPDWLADIFEQQRENARKHAEGDW